MEQRKDLRSNAVREASGSFSLCVEASTASNSKLLLDLWQNAQGKRPREAVRPDRQCFSHTACCWTTCGCSYQESFCAVTLAASYFSIFSRPAPASGGMLLDVGERKTPTTSAFTAVLAEGRPPPKLNLGQVPTPPQLRVAHQ